MVVALLYSCGYQCCHNRSSDLLTKQLIRTHQKGDVLDQFSWELDYRRLEWENGSQFYQTVEISHFGMDASVEVLVFSWRIY